MKNAVIIIVFWIISLGSAFLLFLFLDSYVFTESFMGFKAGGGIAGCILIFILLMKKFESLNYKSEIEIHLRDFIDEEPLNLKNCKFEYRILNKTLYKSWKKAEYITQDKDRFIYVPNVCISDILEFRIIAENGTWQSDKVQSSKRHLLFSKT
ncbi:MAG: hypothetical protein PVF73_11720 [Bacteroidales bacterium]|jgi:hypothetical protein